MRWQQGASRRKVARHALSEEAASRGPVGAISMDDLSVLEWKN